MALSEFEASLVYRASSRIARTTQRNPASKTKEREPGSCSTPLIPALVRQRQADSKFGTSLVYRMSSRTARETLRNPVSETNKTKQKTKERKKDHKCH